MDGENVIGKIVGVLGRDGQGDERSDDGGEDPVGVFANLCEVDRSVEYPSHDDVLLRSQAMVKEKNGREVNGNGIGADLNFIGGGSWKKSARKNQRAVLSRKGHLMEKGRGGFGGRCLFAPRLLLIL